MSRTKRTLRTTAGAALIAGGAALLILPGPGLAMIAAGITLLPDGRKKLVRVREIVEPRALKLVELLRATTARAGRFS